MPISSCTFPFRGCWPSAKAAKAAALEATPHDYAVLICARNESAVIADLIGSLRSQTYDQSLLHIFVLADNCTDDTSAIARSARSHRL